MVFSHSNNFYIGNTAQIFLYQHRLSKNLLEQLISLYYLGLGLVVLERMEQDKLCQLHKGRPEWWYWKDDKMRIAEYETCPYTKYQINKKHPHYLSISACYGVLPSELSNKN